MKILIDSHLHVYPFYDYKIGFNNFIANLTKNSSEPSIKVGFLAERFDCDFFDYLRTNDTLGIKVTPDIEKGVHLLNYNNDELFLFAGRQVVTKERLEVLSLLSETKINDGMGVMEVIKIINEDNGIAVLSWAFGKWMFKRKEIVSNVIDSFTNSELFLCDSSMRPNFLPYPDLFKKAKDKNIKILAGSDPLPFKGDEKVMGEFGASINTDFDKNKPLTSMFKILKDEDIIIDYFGRRTSTFTFFKRMIRQYI